MEIFLGILFGLLGGVIAGMGMGGGTLLIPLLVIFMQFSQLQAQTINLIAFLFIILINFLCFSRLFLIFLYNFYKLFVKHGNF